MRIQNVKRERKIKHLFFRTTNELYEYVNASSRFFDVSNSYLIKERCLSYSFPYICDKELDSKSYSQFQNICDGLNSIAFDFNKLYKSTLSTNRLDLIFNDKLFEQYLSRIKSVYDEWRKLFEYFSANHVLDYSAEEKTLEAFHDIFDEYNPSSKKCKRWSIRVSDSFYNLLVSAASSINSSVSQLVLESCMNPSYIALSSVMRNKDFNSLSHSLSNNIRQIHYSLIKLDRRNIECSGGFKIESMFPAFGPLVLIMNEFLESWNSFDDYTGDIEKEMYYTYVKKRNLYKYIEDVLVNNDRDYLKTLRNRENQI